MSARCVPGGRSARLRRRHAGVRLGRARLELSPIGLMSAASMLPDRWQAGFLTSGSSTASRSDIYVLTSRQAGKSTASAALAAWLAWRRPRMLVMIVSPTLRQSVELGAKVRSYLPHLPVRVVTESKLSVELANGSRVECLPGRPETIRGYSPDLIVADEAAWISDELYEALSPARARTGGRLVALSTPGAPKGWFYRGWTSGEESGIERVRVPWTEVSGLSAEIVEAERALMPEARWRAEFECEFLRPAGQVFDTSGLAGLVDDELPIFEQPGWGMAGVLRRRCGSGGRSRGRGGGRPGGAEAGRWAASGVASGGRGSDRSWPVCGSGAACGVAALVADLADWPPGVHGRGCDRVRAPGGGDDP